MLNKCNRVCVWIILFVTVNSHPTNRTGENNANNLSRSLIRFQKENKPRIRILTLLNPHKGTKEQSEQDIIFPDTYEVLFDPIPRIDGSPKCAADTTYCENFESYPYYHLKHVLQEKTHLMEYFGKDEEGEVIANRNGDIEESYNFLCPSAEKTIFPKLGKNKNNKWKYIINQGEDGYVQGVRVEVCRRRTMPCEILGDLPLGYTTSCKQKYIFRRLLSLTDGGAPLPDSFQLPSACCCSYRRDVEFLSRYGRDKMEEQITSPVPT